MESFSPIPTTDASPQASVVSRRSAEPMDLTDLRCMLVVAEEECVTRAAARLYFSQPALSRRIRRLERSVGSTLFLRHSRSVSLTPAGAALAAHARDVIDAADLALRRAQAAARDARTHLEDR